MIALLTGALVTFACLAPLLAAQEISATTEPDEPPTQPSVIDQTPPVYPKAMKSSRTAGEVTIGFIVNTDGDVESPTVVRSTNPDFEQPAINAVLQWKFKPGTKDGKPVKRRAQIPIKFTPTPDDVAIQPAVLFDTSDKPDTPPVLIEPYIKYPANLAKAGTQGYVIAAFTTYPAEDFFRVVGTDAKFEDSVRDSFHARINTRFNARVMLDKPAQANGEDAASYSWAAIIFNPASTAPGLPDATASLLKVAPVLITTAQKNSLPENEKRILRGAIAIDATGVPREITLETKSAAAQALLPDIKKSVSQWSFAPARAGGQPVAAAMNTAFVLITVPDTISGIKANNTPPKPIKQPPPWYPVELRRRGIQGNVTLLFYVNKDGKAEDIKVMGSTHRDFEWPAIDAIKQWRFKPALEDGIPIRMRIAQPVAFRLFN